MRIAEGQLRRIIKKELLEHDVARLQARPYSRPYSRPSEVKVVSPFMWYEDRLFVVAEFERFVGGPKLKTGFYTSRGESIAGTEHKAASWQPCLGINQTDGWIKKLPGKWAEEGSLLDMVSGELLKRYDDAWQRQKREELCSELYSELKRRGVRRMSRSALSETQIEPINNEFKKHGALFEPTFIKQSLESEQDIDDYREFADGLREGRTRRKEIIREAVVEKFKDLDKINFDKIRGMKPSEIHDLPKEQRPLASAMMSGRDTAGRRVATIRADLASGKIFELMDILRDADSYDEFERESRRLIGSLELYEHKVCAKVLSEIRKRLSFLGRRFGAVHATDPSVQLFKPLEPMQYAELFWPDFSSIVLTEVMTGEAIREFEASTGKILSRDMETLRMTDDDIRLTAQQLVRGVESRRQAEAKASR